MKQTKIVILGAGHVGTHCALSLMFRGLANEIVLIDTDEEKAKSQALDLDDMGACLPAKVVILSGRYEDSDQYYKSCGCSRRMFEESVRYREIPLL